jgi:hypothetical protein
MATRLKTVEYAMPVLASMTDNTLTALTQITIYLPEAPATTDFKSVIAVVSAMQTAAATGNINTRRIDFSVGGATADTHTNTSVYSGSGEDIYVFHAADMTSHFQTNWTTGTSQTFDASVLMDGTATGAAFTNINVTIFITYEYDDTSTTQIKTVRIPLNCGTDVLDTTKPGTALDTIPNLSTELPEASKVYRNTYITFQGMRSTVGATDSTITLQLDNTTAQTTNTFEGFANTSYSMRYVWDCSAVLNTASSMGFFAWSSLANAWYHMQAWLTVTYEFDATSSNDTYISLMLPMEVNSPMGGLTDADYQRGIREFWIEEPGTVTTKSIAFYSFWDQAAPLAGMNQRIGTGAFVSFTNDNVNIVAGTNAAMLRNDAAYTLARGRNTITWDIYRTDNADLGFNVGGFWIINYTAGKPTPGYGSANHTVFWNLGAVFDGVANRLRDISAVAPTLPETDRFYSAIGTRYWYIVNGTGNAAGVTVQCERLAAEGGIQWESAYTDIGHADAETGLKQTYSQVRTLFRRWGGDSYADPSRMDLQTARRWRTAVANNALSRDYLDLIFTYHSIPKTVSGSITNSDGGTVTISLHRESTGEKLLETSRTGDGSYSFTWYDDTENVFTEAYESATKLGRSDSGVAT